jgi:hypothetical protein
MASRTRQGRLKAPLSQLDPCMGGARAACLARGAWPPGRTGRMPGRGSREVTGRRAHGARSTATDSRVRTPEPCARGTWPTGTARRSGARDDVGLLRFYFIYLFSKLHNS